MFILKIALLTTVIATAAAMPIALHANDGKAAPAATTAAPAAGPTAATASLTITFSGITEKSGAIMGAVFSNDAAYDGKGPPVGGVMIPVTGNSVSQTLTGLAPGRYAIKVFHDVDGDGKMSTNPYGMPIEPFAFSNNAKGSMGPAKWVDANFDVKAGDNVHVITID